MSRSALNHQLKRQLQAGKLPGADPFAVLEPWLPDEERVASSAYEFHGNSTSTFNIEPVLAQNIVESNYFLRELLEWPDPADLISEAKIRVTNVEPYAPGGARAPSTAFCILMRLMVARLTRRELSDKLLASPEPLLRALGLLYVRYTAPPAQLWDWFAEALEDEGTPICPGLNAAASQTTIAAFARGLLNEPRYFGSQLPPLPIKLRTDLTVKLMLLEKDKGRRAGNARRAASAPALLAPGAPVRARFHEDEKWYDATADGPDTDSPLLDPATGAPFAPTSGGAEDHRGSAGGRLNAPPQRDPRLVAPAAGASAAPSAGGRNGPGPQAPVHSRYWVTYSGFGDSESVPLGRIELPLEETRGVGGSGAGGRASASGVGDYGGREGREEGPGRGGSGRAGISDRDDGRDLGGRTGGYSDRDRDWDRGRGDDQRPGRADDPPYGGIRGAGGGRPRNDRGAADYGGSGRDRDDGARPASSSGRCYDDDEEYRGRRGGGGRYGDDRGGAGDAIYRREQQQQQNRNGGSGGGGRYGSDREEAEERQGHRDRGRSPSRSRSRGPHRDGRRHSRSRSPLGPDPRRPLIGPGAGAPRFGSDSAGDDVDALRRQVTEAARAGAVVAAGSRDYHAGRPAGVKSALATRGGAGLGGSDRWASGRPSDGSRSRSRDRETKGGRHGAPTDSIGGGAASAAPRPPAAALPPRPAPSAEALARQAELQARYGGGGGGKALSSGAARDGDEEVVNLSAHWRE